ncbi:MAG: MarR family transcriptional regulator [Actinomycetales bacterium]|nr:MarR family transcriptional regulator [Actinomycetales bacterium]
MDDERAAHGSATPDGLDHVGRILAQWHRERPDLDVSPMGVIGRLHRLARVLDAELAPVFAAEGLRDGDFDVLAALRRSGAPYELSPGELVRTTMVTSGATSKRLDRLEAAGLVARRPDPDDARGRRVRLTDGGVATVDRLVAAHVGNEHRLLAGLDADDRAALAVLLERWGRALGDPPVT